MPWIETEFNNHMPVFHRYGFGWSVTSTVSNKPYSDAETMPEAVLSEMYKQLLDRDKKESEKRKNESLENFKKSMPHFDRRIADLEASKSSLSGKQYLNQSAQIAKDMWDIGSRRSASDLLIRVFEILDIKALDKADKIDIAIELGEMLLEQKDIFRAQSILTDFVQAAETLPALDAVVAAPEHHRVLLENERVRVLDTRILPGNQTPVHTHRWSSVYYVLSTSDFIRFDANGKPVFDSRGAQVDIKSGTALSSPPIPPHSVRNVGDTEIHIISMEIKD
jgi:mannose-6-phosphate isomerase-like protein (cupin superfamily)